MKKIINLWVALLLTGTNAVYAQASADGQSFAKLPQARPGEEVADFAAGCFWASSEAFSELKGVSV